MKLTKILNLFKQARVIAENSPDEQTKVGAILVHSKTGAILSTGYNGFIRKAQDDKLPKTRPDKYPYIIHAEQNLICNAARHGISMDDAILICTLSPCIHCMRLIYQCGITKIYCQDIYQDFTFNKEMKDLEITITPWGNSSFFEINIQPK